jgi:formamidopyrimidine-DNA glycosylase
MPELPEVETIARGLAARVTGDVIASVWLGSKPEPLKSPAAKIAATLERKRIAGVRRIGKHIVFDLELNGGARTKSISKRRLAGVNPGQTQPVEQWIVHLGMSGRVLVCWPEAEIEKHTHAIVKLASGKELRFVDPRRFGRLSVAKNFQTGGREPLEIELRSFVELFRGRQTPIKSALLNQNLLRGVGNIYADEALFRAGIRPRRRAGSLTSEEFRRLYFGIREVLKEAITVGGSSISDYVDSNGDAGSFQRQHRVYGREDEPCLICKTPIKRVVIAGRSSHYCRKCQS